MSPLDLVKLTPLMEVTRGRPEITIGLIDGPVVVNHPDLAGDRIRELPGRVAGSCTRATSAACRHGTFVAGILVGRRGSAAPAICPGCSLLLRPIFAETATGDGEMPSATPEELAEAIVESVDGGARVLNLSVALAPQAFTRKAELAEALDYAARRGVLAVAAAGNQGTIGSSPITRHPWVIAVAAFDSRGRPLDATNLGNSLGRRGLGAPGEEITSLGTDGQPHTFGGTSAAAPFVTGAIALLWSEFPAATGAELRTAVTQAASPGRRTTIVPPLLDAWAAYQVMKTARVGRI